MTNNVKGKGMGIFNIFKRKNKIGDEEFEERFFSGDDVPNDEPQVEQKPTKRRWDYKDKEERDAFIHDNCEKILEAKAHYRDAKMEYGQIDAYLNDMRKIDEMGEADKKKLKDAARSIVTMERERTAFLGRTVKITQEQYNRMEEYGQGMEKEVRKLRESEEYALKIASDRNHLENEKENLAKEEKDIIDKQYFLKQMAIITCVLVLSLMVLLFVFYKIFDTDMTVPYLLTILLAMLVYLYIFFETQKNKKEIRLAEAKQNRAVNLLNKVSIKFVNNTTLLESMHERLQVGSVTELEYIWKQYLLAKEEERKHRENARVLEENVGEMVAILKEIHVTDSEVWTHQATAILDEGEMKEIRKRLEARKIKANERMEYNRKVKEHAEREMGRLLQRMPEVKPEMMRIFKEHQIEWDEG